MFLAQFNEDYKMFIVQVLLIEWLQFYLIGPEISHFAFKNEFNQFIKKIYTTS